MAHDTKRVHFRKMTLDKPCAVYHTQQMSCFEPTTNPELDAERTALTKTSPQVDAAKVSNASPFTPQSRVPQKGP